ncbi:MAG: UvrD-helicase domain-containing protein, partial [Planctomycetota bacterium]|nr:UvrD-helicase domain-containing protein [Planctomycetota bacterium]
MNDATFIDRRIMASAGTGKTWNLVARYLDLVLAGVDPATILATTFTRAAAAEIRDRVLTDAAALVLEPEARTAAAEGNRFTSGVVDEGAAHRLLHELVARLPALQIRTLDSLFASLAKGLGAASSVPAGARMVDETEAAGVLRSAIGDALDESDEGELLATLETLGRGATRVAVVGTVERAISGLLVVADESTEDAWRWPIPPRDADALEAVARTLAVPDSSMGKGMLAAFQSLERLVAIARTSDGGIWQAIQESKLVFAGGPEGSGVWSRQTVPESMMPALGRLHALALDGNRRNLARRTACLRDLVERVAPHLRRRKRSARVAVFDDFVRALDPQRADASPEGLAELWFRLDTSLEHLLLDEFQDTSATQLRAIRPVATEILAGGDGERPRSVLVVGDVKQSIYGWRGGDPAILERLDEIVADGPVALDDRTLVTSYRSSRAVIDLVNAVFDGIADNAAVQARSSEAAVHFGRLFRTHDTVKRHAGRAAVEFLPHASDAAERLRVVAESAADAAADLVDRHGLSRPDGEPSVAVLVRSNKPIGPIVEALRARGVPASGRGGGSLLDAEAAVVVVQAFRLAADPEDRLAAEDIARSPLGPLVGLEPSDGHARVSDPDRRTTARHLRTLLGDEGPATVVDRWRRELMDRLTAREAARLRQMVELLESVDGDAEAD